MPELAEVEFYRRQWVPAIGQRVRAVCLRSGKRVFRGEDIEAFRANLVGKELSRSEGHGKKMLFVFGEVDWVGVHLGMTGRTLMVGPEYQQAKHDHLAIELGSGDSLIFSDSRMFGRVRYARGDQAPDWWSGLPPQILSPSFTRERVSAFLDRRGRAPLKAVLLMQEIFPGVGNWMADEILWRARIRPARRACELGPRKRAELHRTVIEVCEDAMRVIAPDWSRPPNEWLFNHRWKDGGICPRTGGVLIREEIGGRTTCWSPMWQR